MPTENEFERRWLVLNYNPEIVRFGHILIEQAYFGVPDGLRVRLTKNGHVAKPEVTLKTGHGIVRQERNEYDIGLNSARLFIDTSPFKIKKKRYCIDGWDVDFFLDDLTGLVLAEKEMATPTESVRLPSWIYSAIEVTDALSSRLLAQISADLSSASQLVLKHNSRTNPIRLVLTGGPGSGKTTAMEQLQADFGDQLHCVAEVATTVVDVITAEQLTAGRSATDRRRLARKLRRVQLGIEELSAYYAYQAGRTAVMLDKGTLDILKPIHHNRSADFDRYQAVIQLDVPNALTYRDCATSHHERTATWSEARQIGEKIYGAWLDHPKFTFIENDFCWENKYARLKNIVANLLSQPATTA